MKIDWKKLILCLAIPLAVGGLSALVSGGMADYEVMVQPPLSPPGWLFPVVWTVLYLLMGYASYRVLESGAAEQEIRKALTLYGLQLFANFVWPLLFFGAGAYLAAMVCLLLLWLCVVYLILLALDLDRVSAWLLAPYLLWLTFAAYLNFGVFLRNL